MQLSNMPPELLAPAGNMTCLHAAVSAGADAVYLGADHFNARRSADNFTLETLAQACDYAHLRKVKIYLTLNTVILPSELADVLELARQAYRAGVDAFIVQDLGLAAQLAQLLPEARIHASTQMNIHDTDGLVAVAALGIKRVTLARELSLEEITHLAQTAAELGLEVECFAHGALCICYSGQCYMSSMIGGRSANRGRCAQACRLPYSLHNRALKKDLPSPGEHLLSPKDLCTAEILPELVATGVSSLKIEGRMKSPEYVFDVVSTYRALLDALQEAHTVEEGRLDSGSGRANTAQMQTLSEAFSRGFTTAYLEHERGNDMMSYGRPNNRGVRIGRVQAVRDGRVVIDDGAQLNDCDVIEFWTNRGHFVHTIDALVRDASGFAVVTGVKSPVGKGDRVFRVRNAQAAFEDKAQEPRVPIVGALTLQKDTPATLTFTSVTQPDISVTARGDVVEPARTKALEVEDVYDHIDRMGTTPFVLTDLTIILDEGVGMGFSALHKLRARAAQELQEAMLAPYHGRTLEKTPSPTLPSRLRKGACKVCVLATNPACARAAKKAGADAIYVPVHNYRRGEALIAGQVSSTAEQAGYPKQCIPVLPVVDHEGDKERSGGFDIYKRVKADAPVLCQNIGQVVRCLEAGAHVEVGPNIPVTNELDLALMARLGVEKAWLSPELSLTQIEELGSITPLVLGITIMGAQELMVCEHCLLMSQGPCNQECTACVRRKSPHYLKDRKGYEMPIVTDSTGRSHLYNAVSLDIANQMPELISAGISQVMVDTTLMNVAETTKAVARAVRARDIAQKSGDRVSKAADTTSGHLFRGVS